MSDPADFDPVMWPHRPGNHERHLRRAKIVRLARRRKELAEQAHAAAPAPTRKDAP